MLSQKPLINSVLPQIRNSRKYVTAKDQKEFRQDLKKIYQATTREKADQALGGQMEPKIRPYCKFLGKKLGETHSLL